MGGHGAVNSAFRVVDGFIYLLMFRSYLVVWVGGELLAGLVPKWVWSPLPGFRPERPAGQCAVWPGKRCFPEPHVWLHRRRDLVGASGDHEERWRQTDSSELLTWNVPWGSMFFIISPWQCSWSNNTILFCLNSTLQRMNMTRLYHLTASF